MSSITADDRPSPTTPTKVAANIAKRKEDEAVKKVKEDQILREEREAIYEQKRLAKFDEEAAAQVTNKPRFSLGLLAGGGSGICPL